LATDALKDLKDKIKWKSVVLILSGWNFDFERLQEVRERSMKFEWVKKYFIISFPQRPGALKEFLNCLWPNDDIARFEYLKKSNKNQAPVFIWIETNDTNNWKTITKKMEEMWFRYRDVTNDDLYFDLLV
jgi:threonine dehydratase